MWSLIYGLLLLALALTALYYIGILAFWFKDFFEEAFIQNKNTEENSYKEF
tara:strand:+ start:783 stop:935 length:153 start_codon:yes stop_codon:yes gene_type:complete